MGSVKHWFVRDQQPGRFWSGCLILMAFSLPISVTLDNVLLVLLFPALLMFRQSCWTELKLNPVAQALMALFLCLLLATNYGPASYREAFSSLLKYLEMAIVPLFMVILFDTAERLKLLKAFMLAMALTLAVSCWLALSGSAPPGWLSTPLADDPNTVFHSRITQSNFMAIAVYMALLMAREAKRNSAFIGWLAFALLGSINVLFLVKGRTGYLILFLLLLRFFWCHPFRIRTSIPHAPGIGRFLLLLVLAGVMASTVFIMSPSFQQRINQAVTEFRAWEPQQGIDNSIGQRLDFYYNTSRLVLEHPFGVGTGSFAQAYADMVAGTGAIPTRNPHNDILMFGAQAGWLAILLSLGMFATIWYFSGRLREPWAPELARGLVLAYLVNSMFNSGLLDHAEGLFFSLMLATLFSGLRRKEQHG